MPDRDAHEVFVAHYEEMKDKVFTYLMYRLNFDRETAEDLLMDIILKAYENFHQFDSKKGSFKNWIFGIAHNHLLNHWRDRKTEVPIEQAENVAQEDNYDETPSPFIAKVLSLLNDTEREMITLRYLSDLNYEEIAAITGKKEGAIRTSLSRALDRFKTLYDKLYRESNE